MTPRSALDGGWDGPIESKQRQPACLPDRNHWVPEEPSAGIELFIANAYRRKNAAAEIRIIVWDKLMIHDGHLELPRPLAAATCQVVRRLAR